MRDPGLLVKKSDEAGTVMIVNAIFEHITATNQSTSYYLFGGQRPSAGSGTVAMRTGGTVYWLHGDHLGSASLTTNAGGQKVAELRYLPFGETRWAWGTTPTDRRYTGQRELAGVGLYDYNARMYWPAVGRFVSADTVVPGPGNPQAFNRYAYALGNPIRFSDPSGHHWRDAFTYEAAIIRAADVANIPVLAVAAAIGSQTNGYLGGAGDLAGKAKAYVRGSSPSLGPGQVRVENGQTFYPEEAWTWAKVSQAETSIELRARVMGAADQAFLATCGGQCTSQHMNQDRWLVFALSQNDSLGKAGVEQAWNGSTFNWDSLLMEGGKDLGQPVRGWTVKLGEGAEIRIPNPIYDEQGGTSRNRYLLRQFAEYLEELYKNGFGGAGWFKSPDEMRETVDFLNCMGQAEATTGGCR